MTAYLQQLFTGLATGGIYAIVAIALVMIFKSTGHVNFALGELSMFATFVASALINRGISYWVAFVLVATLAFIAGAVLEIALMRRMQGRSPMAAVAVLIGLMLTFNGLAGWTFGFTARAFPSPFPAQPLFGNRYISSHEIGIVAITAAVVLGVFLLFEHTRLGLAMRGVADNAASSRLSGIHTGRVLAFGWGLAAAIGAIAGMLIAHLVLLESQMMSGIMIYGFAAAIIGGIDSPAGAVLGGFLVGVLENLAGAYVVGPELKLPMALLLIVGVLMTRPSGLLGQKAVTRV